MLSQKYRFHSRGGVKYTYKNGKIIRRPQLSVIYNRNDRGFVRFAVIVSKKVLKSAVGRNRIRRRVYEAIRLELNNLNLRPSDFLFVIYRAEILDMDFKELRRLVRLTLDESQI